MRCPSTKSNWIEITEKFKTASSNLASGLLIHSPAFNLFDAMSAIEIADSKMDAVVQWRQLPSYYPHTLKEALDKQLLKLQGHTHFELIGVFDELLACLATWLNGHTLAQTLFTCMYVLEPSQFENSILCGFVMATIRVADMFREVIARGGVYVEDEPQVICVGLNTRSRMEDSTVLSSLKLAQDSLSRYYTDEAVATSDGVSEESVQAISSRIDFIKSLFLLCVNLKKRLRESVLTAEQDLSNALRLLEAISSTVHLGERLDPADPLKLGFHPLINQHTLPPSTRPYSILPRDKAIMFLTTSLQDIKKMFEIGRLSSLFDILSSLAGLCSVDKSPNILSRSFIACYCLDSDRAKCFNTKTIEDMAKDDLRSLYNPPCLNARSAVSTTALCKDLLDRFLGHAHLPLTELFKTYCYHRAKQRNIIARYLKSVGDLQSELEIIDQQLNDLTAKIDPQRQHNSSFSSWFIYYVSHLFVDYLHMGFEYDLYSPFEYHYILWYLEYSYGWKQMTIKAAGKQLLQEPNPASGKNKKKSKTKKKELPKEKEAELSKLQVKRMICIGLMRTCEALMLDGDRVPKPNFQFSAESLIFYNRFLPFTSVLSPHPLTYLDYQQLAGIGNYHDATLNLYNVAFRHYENTKTTLESMQLQTDPELGQLLKVVKTNLVIMKLASSGHKGDLKLPPQLDFSLHKNFPIIRL